MPSSTSGGSGDAYGAPRSSPSRSFPGPSHAYDRYTQNVPVPSAESSQPPSYTPPPSYRSSSQYAPDRYQAAVSQQPQRSQTERGVEPPRYPYPDSHQSLGTAPRLDRPTIQTTHGWLGRGYTASPQAMSPVGQDPNVLADYVSQTLPPRSSHRSSSSSYYSAHSSQGSSYHSAATHHSSSSQKSNGRRR